MNRFSSLLAVAAALAGCGDDAGTADDAGADAVETVEDVPGETPPDDAAPDVEDVDDADAPDDGEAPPDPCALLGLPVRPFEDAPSSTALGALAADVTVQTREGPWNLRSNWSGCDVLLFIQDAPAQNAGWPTGIWERDVRTLLRRAPRNTRFLFVSTQTRWSSIDAALAALEAQVDTALAGMSEEERAWWPSRIHYLTEPAATLDGWLGTLMRSPGWGIGIDRFQRIRYVGSYGDYARYDAARRWFAPNLSMAANEAVYYNFEAERDARTSAEDAAVVPLFAGEVLADPEWAGTRHFVDVVLPSAAEMTGYDSLALDLTLACDGEGEYGTCPAWDYIVHLYLCDETDPSSCDVEFGRWITTYHREGRWVHDVSPLLPLIAGGGARRFAFYTQQPYEVTLDLRLSNQAKPDRPVETHPLFTGGAFDADYDARHPAMTVAIPADAARVELATALTGHGMADPGNCAEFCDTRHEFLVNGEPTVRDFPRAGTDRGCMDEVDRGTVPNQYGTWWYGRSGWCPGREVALQTIDVTSQALPGEDNLFEYRATFAGAPYTGGGAHIVLSSWVVVYR